MWHLLCLVLQDLPLQLPRLSLPQLNPPFPQSSLSFQPILLMKELALSPSAWWLPMLHLRLPSAIPHAITRQLVSNYNTEITIAIAPPPRCIIHENVSLSFLGGQDYMAANGFLMFSPMVTSLCVTITIADDVMVESQECFDFVLQAPMGEIVTPVCINDNDSPVSSKWSIQIYSWLSKLIDRFEDLTVLELNHPTPHNGFYKPIRIYTEV